MFGRVSICKFEITREVQRTEKSHMDQLLREDLEMSLRAVDVLA